VLAVLLGIYASLNWDIPTGPVIVVAASFLFFVSKIFFAMRNDRAT
jgi:ABC-type Mn2+/Zn2+ transport system permease subunit